MISFQQLIEKTLTPAEKKKREEIAKAIEKDNPNMPMDKKMAIATATAKRVAESDFEPHMMYDPKTGKGYKANKPEDHVRMKKMGYTHEKPELKENYRTAARHGMGTEGKKEARVGLELDYYEPVRGDKKFGTIVKKDAKGYTVKDSKSGKLHKFAYHDRIKARKFMDKLESVSEDGQYVSPSQMTDKQKADLKAKQQAERERNLRRMKAGQKDSEEERARKQRERERRLRQYAGKRESVNEDGHNDVESMKNKVKTAMSALQKMNAELGKLGDQESLPTWWTNKVAVAVDKLDGMADYIDTQVESVNEVLNYHTGVEGKKVANQMQKIKSMKPFAPRVARMKKLNSYDLEKVVGIGKKKEIETVMQKAFATEAFKPYMNKDYPRIVDFYIQFRGGRGDRITSPDNKKDYEKALKLTQAFMRKNKIKSKLETGTPEEGSSAYKISLILNSKKPEYRVDLRPLVNQIAKLKTAEDHGGGYDKPLKEGNLQELSLDHNMLQRQFPNVWATKDAKLYRVLSHLIRQDGYNDPKKAYDKDKKKFVDTLRDIAKNPKKYEKSFGRGFSQHIEKPKKGQAFAEGKSFSEIMEVSQQAQIRKAIDIASSMGGNMTAAVKRIEAIKKGLSKHKNVQKALQLANEEVISEVTDVEINLMKQLSKDAEKLKKNYHLIVKAGDKELKDRKYNKEYKAILDMQQAVLSLIGKLTNKKMMQKEEVELYEKLSKQDLKFMSMMYDKKGKLTDVGKAVMNYKPGDNIRKIVQNLNKKEAVSPAQQAAIAISKKEKGEKPLKESRARRDAMRGMRADPDYQPKGFKDIRATDADRKAASKNVLMQIRKATDLPKGGEIEFPSGKKGKISQADAKKVDKMFNVLKKPQDKEKFQKVISKDLNSIKNLLKRLGR